MEFNSKKVVGIESRAEPVNVVIFFGIPQSSRCSLSQMLLIFKTLASPAVIKVSAAVSIASPASGELSSFTIPYPLSAGISAIACDIRA